MALFNIFDGLIINFIYCSSSNEYLLPFIIPNLSHSVISVLLFIKVKVLLVEGCKVFEPSGIIWVSN